MVLSVVQVSRQGERCSWSHCRRLFQPATFVPASNCHPQRHALLLLQENHAAELLVSFSFKEIAGLPCWCPPPQVAWGRHETIGEYMTAALVWLENRGQADIGEVAARFRVPRLADLQVDPAVLARRR